MSGLLHISSIASVLLILVVALAHAQVLPDQDAYNAAFARRSAALQENLLKEALRKANEARENPADPENPANVMSTKSDRIDLVEAALLIRSRADTAMGNQAIRVEAKQPFRGGMFYIHDVMAALLYGGDGVSESTWRAVRKGLTHLPIYRGDTENHWVLYYTGMYLAAQTWPNEPGDSWFNGRSSAENMADAEGWLNHWMDLTTTIGQGEFDSPTYMIVYLSPMLVLHQFCQDPVLKARAEGMLNWLFTDYALEYLNGLFAGAHSRDYTYDVVKPEGAPAVGWGWLHFGGPNPVYRSDNLLSAWSDYRLPVVINNVANDRSVPYTDNERKRVRNIFRYGDEMNPPVYKTTYMTKDFAVGSIQGGILQPIQQHTWDITFVSDKPNATIFTLHPFYSGYELAMFFPEEIEWLSEQVDRYHLVYTDPDKWNSSSPYERTFQHENTIIVLYDIAPDAHHDHVDGFFPKTLNRREEEGGWIFADAGRTYVAVYPLEPYEWIEEEVDWRLRSQYRRNGFVVEARSASDFESFESFKSAIQANELDTSKFNGAATVEYVSTTGHRMHFQYPDTRILDGNAVNLDEIPLFRSPYVNADGATRKMVISHGGMELVVQP